MRTAVAVTGIGCAGYTWWTLLRLPAPGQDLPPGQRYASCVLSSILPVIFPVIFPVILWVVLPVVLPDVLPVIAEKTMLIYTHKV